MAKAKEQGHGQEGAFYAVAGVQKDGTLQEIGGEGRTWRTLEDFHRERGWRAGTVVTYYPADFGRRDAEGRG
jgi:hypothetical protein